MQSIELPKYVYKYVTWVKDFHKKRPLGVITGGSHAVVDLLLLKHTFVVAAHTDETRQVFHKLSLGYAISLRIPSIVGRNRFRCEEKLGGYSIGGGLVYRSRICSFLRSSFRNKACRSTRGTGDGTNHIRSLVF